MEKRLNGVRADDDDVHKSLEEIIKERQIKYPSSPLKDIGKRGFSSKKSQPKLDMESLDPLTHSLEEMIISGKQEKMEERPDQNGKRKRVVANENPFTLKVVEGKSIENEATPPMEVDAVAGSLQEVKDDNLNDSDLELSKRRQLMTPSRAVSFLSTKGMTIEVCILLLANKDSHDTSINKHHLWRCQITCASVKGMADSRRKLVAKEMGCYNFLVNLSKSFSIAKIPKYEVSPEFLIDPMIFYRVEKLGKDKGLKVNHQTVMKLLHTSISTSSTSCKYVCTYFIGYEMCIGEGLKPEFAKLNAAKEAYKHLTGNEFPPSIYFSGEECPPDLNYREIERETYSVLKRKDDPPSVNFPSERDPDEAKRAMARNQLSTDFKRSQMKEEFGRRNLKILVTNNLCQASKETPVSFQNSSVNAKENDNLVTYTLEENANKKRKGSLPTETISFGNGSSAFVPDAEEISSDEELKNIGAAASDILKNFLQLGLGRGWGRGRFQWKKK